MAYQKNMCVNCINWDLTGNQRYESGRMAKCSILSGSKSPLNMDTKIYSAHKRTHESTQSLFTREDFYCNQYKGQ